MMDSLTQSNIFVVIDPLKIAETKWYPSEFCWRENKPFWNQNISMFRFTIKLVVKTPFSPESEVPGSIRNGVKNFCSVWLMVGLFLRPPGYHLSKSVGLTKIFIALLCSGGYR